jgi:hypothetical protein
MPDDLISGLCNKRNPMNGLYSQDTVDPRQPKRWMSSRYVQPAETEVLQLTETQMVQPLVNTFADVRETTPFTQACGGYWTVDKLTRTAVKKDYYMGPSEGFPDARSAQWAAQNIMQPQGLTLFNTY